MLNCITGMPIAKKKLSDIEIQEISLVNKAANNKKFLLQKSAGNLWPSLTGEETSPEPVVKADDLKWPSITNAAAESLEKVEPDEPASDSLWPSISGEVESVEKSDDDDDEDEDEDDDEDDSVEIQKQIPLFIDKANKEQRIIYGIVYEPDTEDAQGDQADANEIEKACHRFMKVRKFKIMHKGKNQDVQLLESYIAPEDLMVGKQKVSKGSWVICIKVNKAIWKAVKDGSLTGFSMAGKARTG